MILNGETLNTFSLKIEVRQGCLLLTFLLHIVLEVPASTIRQEKEIKGLQMKKEQNKLSLFVMIVWVGSSKEFTNNKSKKSLLEFS